MGNYMYITMGNHTNAANTVILLSASIAAAKRAVAGILRV